MIMRQSRCGVNLLMRIVHNGSPRTAEETQRRRKNRKSSSIRTPIRRDEETQETRETLYFYI